MPLTEFETKTTAAIEKLSDSVVTIRSTRTNRTFPFGGANATQGSGSGFIIDPVGHVVTNYHVVDGAVKVEVILKDGRMFQGMVVGGDKLTDVVLIKIDGDTLPTAKLGDSEKLKVGQFALAIGNSLDLPGGHTVSFGAISALARPLPWANFIFEGLIQTDAAINPGNSGGPLADSSGNIIGMNTAMIPFAQGVGFAIPINTIKWVIEQISEKGRVVRPVLGVSVLNLDQRVSRRFNLPVQSGVLITDVSQHSPAHKAGLQPGDIIEKIATYGIKSTRDLLVALSKLAVKESTSLIFLRGTKKQQVEIMLVEGMIQN